MGTPGRCPAAPPVIVEPRLTQRSGSSVFGSGGGGSTGAESRDPGQPSPTDLVDHEAGIR